MAWRRIGDRPLSELMLIRFTDAYMRYKGRWVKARVCVVGCVWVHLQNGVAFWNMTFLCTPFLGNALESRNIMKWRTYKRVNCSRKALTTYWLYVNHSDTEYHENYVHSMYLFCWYVQFVHIIQGWVAITPAIVYYCASEATLGILYIYNKSSQWLPNTPFASNSECLVS